MGKSQRTKGHSFERKVANDLKGIGFDKAKRHLEFQAEEAELGQDIDNTHPFLIQCKAMKNFPNPRKVLDQIKDQEGAYKLAVIKQDRKGTFAVMEWEDFLEILEILKKNKTI